VLILALTGTLSSAAAGGTEQVNIYLVATDDGGASGELFGCNDSLVPVTVTVTAHATVEQRIRAALEALFALDDAFYGESGLYNALHQSNLFVDAVTVTDGVALVQLSGTAISAGTCDDPRIEYQVERTVTQFPEVNGVAVLLNGDWFLPSARGPRCFSETGRCVANEFLTYWENNGGLPVFGYPIGDLVAEDGRVVQYFQRQRFELHPENESPYNVLLGLLGYQAAQERGLLGTGAFQPLPPGTQTTADCVFFPETRHRACFGFLNYWRSHGLDFGDAGMSFRESLMLFGFPISEEFTDPQTGLTVQYFQRAVFEWHPQNQPPWQVLLDLLGAELY
jgi:hypothetical protein